MQPSDAIKMLFDNADYGQWDFQNLTWKLENKLLASRKSHN